jgi:signal transduction histidine kinase
MSEARKGSRALALAGWLAAAALAGGYIALLQLHGGVQLHVYGYLGGVPLISLAFATLGGLVAARLPRNAVGWLMIAIGILLLTSADAQLYAISGLLAHRTFPPAPRIAGWLGSWLWAPGVALTTTLLPLLFPDGQLPSRRWRPFLYVLILALASQAAVSATLSWPAPSATLQSDGQFTGGYQNNALFGAAYVMFVPLALISVASLFMRRRVARTDERQQLKFVLYGALLLFVGLTISAFGNAVSQATGPIYDASSVILVTSIATIPIAAGLAILRYRLYDIDLVISRTVAYGALAIAVTGSYLVIVFGAGSVIGGRLGSVPLSILATALVAVAFQPLRSRLERVANRLVFGPQADPYELLSGFTRSVADAFADEDVLVRMARLLAQGTRADAAGVWVLSGRRLLPVAAWPTPAAPPPSITLIDDSEPHLPEGRISFPVRHGGVLLGVLGVSKRQGEELSALERKLATDIAGHAGLVLRNTALTAELNLRLQELQASRQRLVVAQDTERRRIERDLHDGAQQHLVALKMRLGLLRNLLGNDDARALSLAEDACVGADEALQSLRDLARGVYPSLLAEQGLVAALTAHARKATLPVHVMGDGMGRLDEGSEAAIYFCCLEALQNVQKYAAATSSTITLRQSDGRATFEVRDDGRGFDAASAPRGSGLQNIADRLEAIGGRLDVDSAPGKGTVVSGWLPAPAAVAAG